MRHWSSSGARCRTRARCRPHAEDAPQALARQCAAQALLQALGARRERLDPVLLERERQRTEALLLRVIEWELEP